jgi:hypothetical protein
VTVPDRAELLEAAADGAQGHAFITSSLACNAGRCGLCHETEAHWIHDAGRRVELAAAARLAAGPAADVVDLTVEAPVQLELEVEVPAATVAVIQCSGAKLDRPAPAGELYTGTLHRLEAAAARSTGHRTVILSALHGIVDVDQVVAPYEQRIDQPGAIDVAELAAQLVAAGRPRLVALTSKAYTAALLAAAAIAGCEVETPLAGSRSIFELRSRLCAIRDRRAPLAA